jgi:hypothetical protein
MVRAKRCILIVTQNDFRADKARINDKHRLHSTHDVSCIREEIHADNQLYAHDAGI